MVNSRSLIAVLAATLSAVYAAPQAATTTASTPVPSGADYVNFVPDAGPGCEMSENPFSTLEPEVYNLTSSTGCITPSYSFASYVEMANFDPADTPCAVSVWSEPGCVGNFFAATLTSFEDCIVGLEFTGYSVSMACGP